MDPSTALLWAALQVAGLPRPRIAESVTVVDRVSPIATPSAVTVLGPGELRLSPAFTLDDTLRSVPGFSLFRRSSSRVANPTTQGATLRGLAASGASRALVLADGVPLNDPFGGWVYWNRVPAAAIRQVAVARGAAGDQHGGDALGGVIAIHTLPPAGTRLLVDAGHHGTARLSATAARNLRGAAAAAAVEGVTTDGYETVAPESRGPVDEPAASRYASAYGSLMLPAAAGLTVTASHFRESRRNGTPLQRNSTRVSHVASVIRGLAGAHAGWSGRAHVSAHRYEQTFSAVLDGRVLERPTAEQFVEALAYDASVQYWRHDAARRLELSFDGGARGIGADLLETAFDPAGTPRPPAATNARQFATGGAARIVFRGAAVSAGAAARAESWRTGDNRHVVMSPRLWVAVSPLPGVSLTAAMQSGFRPPTLNELYRPFRVGGVVTEANAGLAPERAHGLEAGVVWSAARATVRALTFWSRIDDAIVNVTLSSTPEQILRRRQNAARIRAAGAELESEFRLSGSLRLTASSSYTRSTFTAGALRGLRVPQVPQVQHALGVRGLFGRTTAAIDWRYTGSQFDDDRNVFLLNGASAVDVRTGWHVRRWIEVFGAIENALDHEQDVGRTPLRTIGLPRTGRVGLRLAF